MIYIVLSILFLVFTVLSGIFLFRQSKLKALLCIIFLFIILTGFVASLFYSINIAKTTYRMSTYSLPIESTGLIYKNHKIIGYKDADGNEQKFDYLLFPKNIEVIEGKKDSILYSKFYSDYSFYDSINNDILVIEETHLSLDSWEEMFMPQQDFPIRIYVFTDSAENYILREEYIELYENASKSSEEENKDISSEENYSEASENITENVSLF